jgi:uncharacterized membrane protein
MKKDQKQADLFSLPRAGYALLGILIINSAYLSFRYLHFYYLGGMLESFDCTDNCDSVMTSQYALLFGIPIPVYGLLSFFSLTVFYTIVDSTKDFSSSFKKKLHKFADLSLQILLIISSVAAMSLLYILYSVMEMHCKFCLTSHICLFGFTIFYFFIYRPRYLY